MIAPAIQNIPDWSKRGATIYKDRLYDLAETLNGIGLDIGRQWAELTESIEKNNQEIQDDYFMQRTFK